VEIQFRRILAMRGACKNIDILVQICWGYISHICLCESRGRGTNADLLGGWMGGWVDGWMMGGWMDGWSALKEKNNLTISSF
jgi:hypothetical protein